MKRNIYGTSFGTKLTATQCILKPFEASLPLAFFYGLIYVILGTIRRSICKKSNRIEIMVVANMFAML